MQHDRRRPPLSDTELEVLKELWTNGPGTVRRIVTRLRRRGRTWAYTTVQTLLVRLKSKGYVRTETGGTAHVFEPVVSRDALLRLRLRDLSDQLCQGDVIPLAEALLRGRPLSRDDVAHIRRVLEEVERAELEPPPGEAEA
jgi:BlaI family penicillinase repressor